MKDSNGNSFTIVNGKIQVGVAQTAKNSGVGDTVSWWNDNKKETNVVVQPNMKYAPVQVTRSGDNINIKAFVDFTGDANNYFPGTAQSYITAPGTKVPQSGYTYAEVAATGIMNNWSGTFYGTDYNFGKGKIIKVKTTIYSNDFSPNKIMTPVLASDKQQFLKINIDNNPVEILGKKIETKIPHTSFKNGWSISEPGEIYMYRNYNGQGDDYSKYGYAQTVAHEFGHVLGLDDAYGSSSRPAAKATVEVPDNPGFYNGDIMRDNGYVTANDIEMAWEAWSTNKWQYFQNYNGHKKSTVVKLK